MCENHVYRFAVVAKPAEDHKDYFIWQTLDVVVFVGDTDENIAKSRAISFLRGLHLRIKKFRIRDQLIEERVLQTDESLRQKYFEAKPDKVVLVFQRAREFFSDKKSPPLCFPKFTEKIFDKVIKRAGGIRFPAAIVEGQSLMTADYIIDDCVLELKFLLKDPYDTNEAKIAELFEKTYYQGKIALDVLDKEEKTLFKNIIMKPIRTHVQKAAKQINGLKGYIKKLNYKGAILIVNQGATALWEKTQILLVEAIGRHTSSIEIPMSIEVRHRTNGMDTNIDVGFFPFESNIPIINRIRIAFHEEFDEAMDEFARGGFITDNPLDLSYSKIIGHKGLIYSDFDDIYSPYIDRQNNST